MSDFVDSLGPAFLGLQLYHVLKRIDVQGDSSLESSGLPVPSRLASSLMVLRNQAPLSLVDIARLLDMPHQLAAQRVKLLKTLRLIEERPDPDDGRRVLLSLNKRGREQAEAVLKLGDQVAGIYQDIFDEIGVDVFDALVRFREALDRQSLQSRLEQIDQKRLLNHAD